MMAWLRALAPYYDYGWFIALLAWAGAAVVARRTVRHEAGWSWLPWAAWPGAVAALVELVSFAWPFPELGTAAGPLLEEDVVLGLLSALTVAGWIWTLPGRKGLRALAGFAVIVAAGVRIGSPTIGALAIAGAGLLAALAHATQRGASPRARAAILFAGAALWLTSAGPLAELGLQPRRAIVLGEWSPVWSLAQAMVAIAALAGVLAPWFANREKRLEWRPFFAGCAVWLALGLGLASAMSASARRNFEAQAVARTKMAAALMNKTAVANLFGPKFQLTEISPMRRPTDGTVLWQAKVPHLAAEGYAVQHELALIGYAGGNTGYFAILFAPRAGWIISISPEGYSANPLLRYKRNDRVGLFAETADDLIDWAEQRARFLPLLDPEYGRSNGIVRARAPLVTDGGKMLGWLQIEFPRAQWISTQMEPRLQADVIVAFGFVLAGLFAVQRVRHREHEADRAAAEAARQADRLKTAFLAKVSHELRTPIQSVLGYGDLLRKSVRDPAGRRQLAALREHGDLMLRLVNDLLDLSAIQAGAFRLVARPTALVDLVHQTVESLRPRAEAKGLALSVAVAAEVPPWAAVDRERVRQVILNLVGNAIKFTDRGRVDVAMTTGSQPDEVVLSVRDTGPGIPADGLAKLFQPFERLDGTAEKEGTGLGLALTAGICRGMGGEVSAESVRDGGATFRAWFRARRCAVPPNLMHSSGAVPPLAGRRVLVVDDNALVRELFLTTLREAGAHCAAAEDGEQALAAAAREAFDAIVLDLSMPRLDGLEVARRLRIGQRSVRVIGVSAHAGELEKEEALAAGMDAFLVKPVDLDVLQSAIVAQPDEKHAPADSAAKLIELLKQQFRGSAADEGAALAAAIAAGDFTAAYARAHHLMNSAAVIHDDRLFAACVTAEQAARRGDAAALQAAWRECEAALAPWITPPAGAAIEKSPLSAPPP